MVFTFYRAVFFLFYFRSRFSLLGVLLKFLLGDLLRSWLGDFRMDLLGDLFMLLLKGLLSFSDPLMPNFEVIRGRVAAILF